MILALLISAALTAPTPRFKRFDSRKIEGRSSRGFLSVATSSAAPYVPMFSFAPASRDGIGVSDCLCENVTSADGLTALSMSRGSSLGFCAVESSQTFAECAADRPRIQNGAYYMEPAATNNVLRNGDLTNPAWGNIATTRTAGQTDPLGGTNATRIQNAACPIVGTFIVVFQNPAGVTNTAASVWIKEASSGPGTAQMYVYGALKQAIPMAYDSTWRKYELIGGSASNEIGFGCVNHAAVVGSSDTGAADFLVFRPQLEDSTFTTSPIATMASAVTRAADTQLSGIMPDIVGPGDFCTAATVQKTNTVNYSSPAFLKISDGMTDDISASFFDNVTELELACGASSDYVTVAPAGTTAHRLVWSVVGTTHTATWDLGALSPLPNTAPGQANDVIYIGSPSTLVSNVQIDVTGCN